MREIGNCPFTTNDLIETMQASDCMCISLEVSRSEACVADPSRMVIHNIIPTFLSSDAFLDSATFKIPQALDPADATGGFDPKKKGDLASGLGRETISAIMPLYLF